MYIIHFYLYFWYLKTINIRYFGLYLSISELHLCQSTILTPYLYSLKYESGQLTADSTVTPQTHDEL